MTRPNPNLRGYAGCRPRNIASLGMGLDLSLGNGRGASGGGVATYEGFIASRGGLMTVAQPAQKQLMSRSPHFSTDTISALKIAVQNFWCNGGLEVGNGGAATCEAFVEYPVGVLTRIQFSGADVGNLPAVQATGSQIDNSVGVIISDSCTVAIPTGTLFWIRILYTNSSGIFHLETNYRDVANGQVVQYQNATTWDGTTLQGTITSSAANLAYCPLAIIGNTTKGSAVLIGDSIMFGRDDTQQKDRRMGVIATSFAADAFAFVNLGVGGATTKDFMVNAIGRSMVFPYASNMVINLGTNTEATGGSTAAVKLSNNQANCNIVQSVTGKSFRAGCRFYAVSVLAQATDTTTGWSTTGGQTPSATAAEISYNALIAAIPSPFFGYIDLNTGLSAFDATLIFNPRTGARSVADGVMASTGSPILTSATAAFVAGDVGSEVRVAGAGAAGAAKLFYILSLNSALSVNLSANPNTTVAAATVHIGGRTTDGLHLSPGGYADIATAGVVPAAAMAAYA